MKKNSFLMKAALALGVALGAMPVAANAQAYDPKEDYKNLDIQFYNDEQPDEGFYINAAGSGQAVNSGGFRHVTTGNDGGGGAGTTVNAMATDQVLYALIAYDRHKHNAATLYDMTDAQNHYDAKSYTVTYVFKNNTTTSVNYAPYAAVDLLDQAATWATDKGVTYTSTETLAMPEQNITLYEQ